MLRSTRVRAAAPPIVSAVRLARNGCNARGHPFRLVNDLDEKRVLLEENASSAFSREKGAVAGGAEAADDAEKKAKAETDRILEGPHPARSAFRPVKELSGPSAPGKGRE